MDNFDGWPVAPVLCISACIIYGLLEMFIERIGLIEKIGKDDIYKMRTPRGEITPTGGIEQRFR